MKKVFDPGTKKKTLTLVRIFYSKRPGGQPAGIKAFCPAPERKQ